MKKLTKMTLILSITVLVLYFTAVIVEMPSTIEQITNYSGGLFNNRDAVKVEKVSSEKDYNGNGIPDSEDFLIGARKDVSNKARYTDSYYEGGYPPDTEGVCTDVIWRAFKEAGYNLKDMIDEDIKNSVSDYPRVDGNPDPNIDFRRVPNLISYFDKNAESLTLEIIPSDTDNLVSWQGGDVVVFDYPYMHVGIVSDKRNDSGVPYMIHNSGPYTREADDIIYWNTNVSKIIRHYRFSS